jgi:hypothetical protein
VGERIEKKEKKQNQRVHDDKRKSERAQMECKDDREKKDES